MIPAIGSTLGQQLNYELPFAYLKGGVDGSQWGREEIVINPSTALGNIKHGSPVINSGSVSFKIPTGGDYTYDTGALMVQVQMDLAITDSLTNILAGTSAFGYIYDLVNTVFRKTSFDTTQTSQFTINGRAGVDVCTQPKIKQQYFVNPSMPTAFSLFDKFFLDMPGKSETKDMFYRRGIAIMEGMKDDVQKGNFPHTFFAYKPQDGKRSQSISIDTLFYNFIPSNGAANNTNKIPIPLADTGSTAFLAGAWDFIQNNAAPLNEQLYNQLGWYYNKAGQNYVTANDSATKITQVMFEIPLNLALTYFHPQEFLCPILRGVQCVPLTLDFNKYYFSDILGGRQQTGSYPGCQLNPKAGVIYPLFDVNKTGYTNVIIKGYQTPLSQTQVQEIMKLPYIAKPTKDQYIQMAMPNNSWYNGSQIQLQATFNSITKITVRYQYNDKSFGFQGNTGIYYAGRAGYLTPNQISDLMNQTNFVNNNILFFGGFNLKLGTKLWCQEALNNLTDIMDIARQAYNAHMSYQIPSSFDDFVLHLIQYASITINTQKFGGHQTQTLIYGQGINGNNNQINIIDKPAIYSDFGAMSKDSDSCKSQFEAQYATQFMPNQNSPIVYEWCTLYDMINVFKMNDQKWNQVQTLQQII